MAPFRRTLLLGLGLTVPGLASPAIMDRATAYTSADTQTATMPTSAMSSTSQLASTPNTGGTGLLCEVGSKQCHGKHIQMCNRDRVWYDWKKCNHCASSTSGDDGFLCGDCRTGTTRCHKRSIQQCNGDNEWMHWGYCDKCEDGGQGAATCHDDDDDDGVLRRAAARPPRLRPTAVDDGVEPNCQPGELRCRDNEVQICHGHNRWRRQMACESCVISKDRNVYCGRAGRMDRVEVPRTSTAAATGDGGTSAERDACDACAMRCGKEHVEACTPDKRWAKIMPCTKCGMDGPLAVCYDSGMGSGQQKRMQMQMQLAAGEPALKKCLSGMFAPAAETCAPGTKRCGASTEVVEKCSENRRWAAFEKCEEGRSCVSWDRFGGANPNCVPQRGANVTAPAAKRPARAGLE